MMGTGEGVEVGGGDLALPLPSRTPKADERFLAASQQ